MPDTTNQPAPPPSLSFQVRVLSLEEGPGKSAAGVYALVARGIATRATAETHCNAAEAITTRSRPACICNHCVSMLTIDTRRRRPKPTRAWSIGLC